jgi:plastocyanin
MPALLVVDRDSGRLDFRLAWIVSMLKGFCVPELFRGVIGYALVVAIGWPWGALAAKAEEPTEAKEANSGRIEGAVIYRRDSSRTWRYSRYYVKNAKSGELAEAVVAIRGEGLNAPKSSAPAEITIDQKNFQFHPETVAVRRGDSVTFTNSDRAAHNVRSSGALANFNITMPVDGKGHTVRLDRAGGISRPVEVDCVFHSNMRAWIFVFDHPYFMLTQADGRFRLVDVPAGKYELEMAHPAGGLRWRKPIEVKPGETLHVDIGVSPDNLK